MKFEKVTSNSDFFLETAKEKTFVRSFQIFFDSLGQLQIRWRLV